MVCDTSGIDALWIFTRVVKLTKNNPETPFNKPIKGFYNFCKIMQIL